MVNETNNVKEEIDVYENTKFEFEEVKLVKSNFI